MFVYNLYNGWLLDVSNLAIASHIFNPYCGISTWYHSYITSSHFWAFWTPLMFYVLKISKNYHFLATLPPTGAYIIYEWFPSKNCWNKWSMFKLFQWNHVYVYWRPDHGHWPRRSGSPKKIGSLDIKYKMAPIIQVRVT